MESCLAIITARGGSKRIPRKNIKDFLGFPIIKYSIDAAVGSGCFQEVMVSTEDEEIAGIAKSLGAVVPFLRAAETASDITPTAEVLVEVLEKYQEKGKIFKYCCCLYPTAPFITSGRLETAFDQFIKSNAESLVPVVRFSFPIQRSLKIENGYLQMNSPEFMLTRSQDLPVSYHDTGQFYFFRVEPFLKHKQLLTDCTIPFEIPESEVQDIDIEEDWKMAELKYTLLKSIDRNN